MIETGRVLVNGREVPQGVQVLDGDVVTVDGKPIFSTSKKLTIVFHKPRGYVCSREGQGSKTVYDILPKKYFGLNYVGRLDKDSSGLLILTSDGELANQLTHPRYEKVKIYEIILDKPLLPLQQQMITDNGIILDDGVSKLILEKIDDSGKSLRVTMKEGRNRQIRRTFSALGYEVTTLHRTIFGQYQLSDLKPGEIKEV